MKLKLSIQKLSKKFIFITSALIVVGISIAVYAYFFSKTVSASWFDESWLYRKAITVTVTSSSSDITNLETLVTVDTSTSGKFQSACGDLRFTNTGGKPLPYYIDSGCGTASTKVWVLVDLVPKNTTTYSMYMYYGNPSATAASDSTKFRLFNGLVGYWTMNESSWAGVAGEVKDSSVNANHGQAAGNATTTSSGKYSYAGTFDGTGDYVSVSDTSALQPSSISVSAWVKTTDTGTYRGIVDRYTGSNSGYFMDLYGNTTAGIPRFDVNTANGGGASSYREARATSAINDGSWHLVTGTYDSSSSTISIYVDGNLAGTNSVGTGTGAVYYNVAHNIFIGGDNVSTYLLNGQIDDLRIYNRALSASEISQLYSNPGNIASYGTAISQPTTSAGSEEQGPGPVGYWKFDDPTYTPSGGTAGQAAKDSSSSKNDGVLGSTVNVDANDPTWTTEDQCISGKCLKFDGTADYVNFGDSSSGFLDFGTSNSFSVGFWVRGSTNASTFIEILSKYGGDPLWEIGLGTTGLTTFQIRGSNGVGLSSAVSTTSITDDKWHYIVGVRSVSDDKVYIYVDGKLENSATDSTTATLANNANLIIGHRSDLGGGQGEYFKGFIDEPKIYPYARTKAQILADYNSGSSQIGSSVQIGPQSKALSDGLVGYWKMDEASGNLTDSSGNSYTGTVNGTTVASGKFGNGRTLNGSTDYAYCSNSTCSNLNPGTSSWSVSAWIKTSSTANYNTILRKGNGGANDYMIRLNQTTGYPLAYFVDTNTNVISVTGTANLADGTWHHVAAVMNKTGNVTLFIDGIINGTPSSASSLGSISNTSEFAIGRKSDSATASEYFNGSLDEVRIYNRALSPKEVSDLYNFAPGPVGYWDFEAGSGTSVVDKSGYANTGTWSGTGTKHWDVGKVGTAGKFNGTDDYTSVGDSSSLGFGTGSFTAEAWVKTSTTEGGVFGKYKITGGEIGWSFELTSGYLRSYLYKGSGSATDTTGTILVNDGKWHHVVLVRDSTNSKIYQYVDGVQNKNVTDNTAGSTLDSNTALRIGDKTETTYNEYFNGFIDDVKIYNYARTAQQIVSDMQGTGIARTLTSKSPIGYWKFDEGQGTTANNSGSQGSTLNGTLTGMSSPATSTSGWTPSGKFAKALSFDGSNDYVAIANSTAISPTNAITLSAWVNADTNKDYQRFIDKVYQVDVAPYVQYTLDWGNGGAVRFGLSIGGAWTSTAIDSALSTGTWYYVAATYDGSNMKIYVNGVLKKTTAQTGTLDTYNTYLAIGTTYGAAADRTEYFDGKIDEVKIYNYALTSEEILTDYNKGSSLILGAAGNNTSYAQGAANQEYCIPGDTTSCAAPVGEWSFDKGSGSTVDDSSGNNNTGTWNGTGTKHWDVGKVGSAGKFNGTDDYVSVEDANSLDFGTGDFTIEMWVNPGTTQLQYANIIGKRTTGGAAVGFVIEQDSNNLNSYGFGTADGTGWSSGDPKFSLTAGRWNHLVVIRTGSTGKVYVDGVLVSSPPMQSGSVSNSSKLSMGIWIDPVPPGRYWNGKIDQVRIFNYARSAAQIAWDYNQGKPVGHWRFDECQGSVANDSSGNKNNGTITIGASGEDTLGTCTTSSTAWGSGSTGKYNSSLSFDGTDDYVKAGDILDNVFTGANAQFTLSTWIKPGTVMTNNMLLAKLADSSFGENQRQLFLTLSTGSKLQFRWYGDLAGNTYQTTWGKTAITNTNTWYHMVAVYDGTKAVASRVTIYVNGVNETGTVTTEGNPSTIADGTAQLGIGAAVNTAGNSSAYNINGFLDAVKIFNYALTASQIKTLYNNGAVFFGPSTGSP